MPSDSPSLWRIGAETAREGYGLFLGNTISTIILAIGSIARLLGSEGYGLLFAGFCNSFDTGTFHEFRRRSVYHQVSFRIFFEADVFSHPRIVSDLTLI